MKVVQIGWSKGKGKKEIYETTTVISVSFLEAVSYFQSKHPDVTITSAYADNSKEIVVDPDVNLL